MVHYGWAYCILARCCDTPRARSCCAAERGRGWVLVDSSYRRLGLPHNALRFDNPALLKSRFHSCLVRNGHDSCFFFFFYTRALRESIASTTFAHAFGCGGGASQPLAFFTKNTMRMYMYLGFGVRALSVTTIGSSRDDVHSFHDSTCLVLWGTRVNAHHSVAIPPGNGRQDLDFSGINRT